MGRWEHLSPKPEGLNPPGTGLSPALKLLVAFELMGTFMDDEAIPLLSFAAAPIIALPARKPENPGSYS